MNDYIVLLDRNQQKVRLARFVDTTSAQEQRPVVDVNTREMSLRSGASAGSISGGHKREHNTGAKHPLQISRALTGGHWPVGAA